MCKEALILLKSGSYDEAEQLLEKARSVDPVSPTPYQYLSQIYYVKRDHARTVWALEQALQRDPGNKLLRDNLQAISKRPM